MRLLVKGATIVNPDRVFEADILVEKGLIKKVGRDIPANGAKVIEAKGKHAFPGFIDMHAHLRTPGREDKETIETGSKAAVKGGFTTLLCMPNTQPAIDNYEIALRIRKEAERLGLLDVIPVGAISKGRTGQELSEFGQLKKAGCLAVSDDGSSLEKASVLRRALEYAKLFDILVISHCEEPTLSNGGVLKESPLTAKWGFPAIPEIAESIIVAREIEMARYLDAPIHLAHISTKRSVELIALAKSQGIKITAETCPHYFTLSLEDVERDFGSNFKVNPPLGDKDDRDALRQALKEGTVDCIATDHAPHTALEKEGTLVESAFGMIGLEFAFSLSLRLVEEKVLTLEQLAERLSRSPARILGLSDRGTIEEGKRADIVITDLKKSWQVTAEGILSRSKNTPFLGQTLKGKIEHTIHKGSVVYNSDLRR